MLVECSFGKGEIFMGSQPRGWAGTWLGVRVIHSVAIQLEKFLRLCFFLPVTAHGKRVLTHLKKKSTDCEVGSLEPIFLEKNPSLFKPVLSPEALHSGAGFKLSFSTSWLCDLEQVKRLLWSCYLICRWI